MTARIGDYALIGDGRSAALVSKAGSVDWLCWPRFDSAPIFAGVVDETKGGFWSLVPTGSYRAKRAYVPGTPVLTTTFETSTGVARLTDLMPVGSDEARRHELSAEHELLRLIECVSGHVEFQMRCEPRPFWGLNKSRFVSGGSLGARLDDGGNLYTLRAETPLTLDARGVSARVRLAFSESCAFSLSFDSEGPAVVPMLGVRCHAAIQRSVDWWRGWLTHSNWEGRWRPVLDRSLLTLKLLSFAPSGAIIAAPTTSLPEKIGGPFNFDYRYCWLRDASLTVRALHELGFDAEASAFSDWLLHSTRLSRPELKVLYDVYGRPPMQETPLLHLDGHRGSKPVRVGNAADVQLQLDSYGEVIDAVARLHRDDKPIDRSTQQLLRQLGSFVLHNWQKPDQGIWEPREKPQNHTHSRLLCWTALDRLLELCHRGKLKNFDVRSAIDARDRIRGEIEARAWNPALDSYTAQLGGESVDASLLLLSWYGFHDAADPRLRSTWQRIQERLSAGPALLYRSEDSPQKGEGAFGICSFWAADYLARGGGTRDEAEETFEQLLKCGNDVGLFGEELEPRTGAALGNFPQTFTHVGLINAALSLEKRAHPESRQ